MKVVDCKYVDIKSIVDLDQPVIEHFSIKRKHHEVFYNSIFNDDVEVVEESEQAKIDENKLAAERCELVELL